MSVAPPVAQKPAHHVNDEMLTRLMKLYRTLCVRHDEVGQEVLLNDILALLTQSHQHELAESVIATCEVNLPHRSNNQAARYFYYVGLTRALLLEYDEANRCLQQALRKAPERALGFRIATTKLSLVVKLLLGEVPPRADFLQKEMRESLAPYLELASSVRFGDIKRFLSILHQHKKIFEGDRTHSLIVRVRQHVIKTSLRRICQAYSRISIPEVCQRLQLEDGADAEYVIAKAIHDGVIDAVIDHERHHLISSDTVDVYSTSEPLMALQRRIHFLSVTHNDAKRSMRYSTADPDLEEERKKSDREATESLLRAMEDEDLGGADFEDGM